jgi:hypothetical protein
MGWMQQVLRTWLGVPLAVPPQITSNLQQLENRLIELEKMVMTHLQHPDPVPLLENEPVDEGRLADLPDAHLGAQ